MKIVVTIIASLVIGSALAETNPPVTQPQPVPQTTVTEKPLKVRANLTQWRKENQEKNELLNPPKE